MAFFLSGFFQPLASAAERPSIEDRVISASFKTLARAFVATADLEALKEKNIRKIKEPA